MKKLLLVAGILLSLFMGCKKNSSIIGDNEPMKNYILPNESISVEDTLVTILEREIIENETIKFDNPIVDDYIGFPEPIDSVVNAIHIKTEIYRNPSEPIEYVIYGDTFVRMGADIKLIITDYKKSIESDTIIFSRSSLNRIINNPHIDIDYFRIRYLGINDIRNDSLFFRIHLSIPDTDCSYTFLYHYTHENDSLELEYDYWYDD